MDGLRYPWCYLHKHPILVISIAIDYKLRKMGLKPDRWSPADITLMDKVYAPIANDIRKYLDR